MIVELAPLCGYRPMIIYIDTERDTALKGQAQRGRVVRNRAFELQSKRWLELRNHMLETGKVVADEHWCRVVLSRRATVVDDVRGLLRPRQDSSS